MKPETVCRALADAGVSFYAGVPDSLLGSLCRHLYDAVPADRHWIAPNEGLAVAAAAGQYLATGRPACVYMQNSGIGNAVNPICSLTSPEVYGIPVVYLIGWRGEPGVPDEPQHRFQGAVTPRLLELLSIPVLTVDADTDEGAFLSAFAGLAKRLKEQSVAVLFRRGCFPESAPMRSDNGSRLEREAAVRSLLRLAADGDAVVASTGKIAREVWAVREALAETGRGGHHRDFLTVGSMGHSAAVALAIAREQPRRRVWCLDGDGALLMHMGAMAMIGAVRPKNLIHIVLDNGAHESVGGFPTLSGGVDFCAVARACGYAAAMDGDSAAGLQELPRVIERAQGPVFVRLRVAAASRPDLGRPSGTPADNKAEFMRFLREEPHD